MAAYTDYQKKLRYGTIKPQKPIKKLGTLAIGVVEATPVVWHGRLLRFEWTRPDGHEFMERPGLKEGSYRFVDMETEEPTPDFAFDHCFGSAYVKKDESGETMYVFGTRGSWGQRAIDIYTSDDLVKWELRSSLEFPEGFKVFNTSVCDGSDGYVMAVECGGSDPRIGVNFTNFFAVSKDLLSWEILPMEKYVYDPSRYTACPVIRYYNGYYYIINLESAPLFRWLPYIVRTKDLVTFEPGMINPVMSMSEEDRIIIRPERFTEAQREHIATAADNNNSDFDICEYEGKTVIIYSWGCQLGREFLALAEYDGPMGEFLESFFGDEFEG